MKSLVLGSSWLFIFVAAVHDADFACQHGEFLETWEQNPFACWVAKKFGLPALIKTKFAGLAFAATLAMYCTFQRQRRLAWTLTLTIGCAYGLLSLHYLVNATELAQLKPVASFAMQPRP
jgi:hypothetical protein